MAISIHAPLAGCDLINDCGLPDLVPFQSTHPLRGATTVGSFGFPIFRHFNPRTPCGVRLQPADLA